MNNTLTQYDQVVAECEALFLKKTKDYGTAWRVLRPISIVDQLFIKANRIRTIQETGVNKVNESITGEFVAMVNYGYIGLMQLGFTNDDPEEVAYDLVAPLYSQKVNWVREIMLKKNHDYGEAWRDMSQESFVDLILMKLKRIKQILQNDGKTIVSEGIDANYTDIINYSIFALILIQEGQHPA
ncbi:DUF1599 domain-containing protein [Gynurincola endophyticus]|jgi:hypothetical protein|uniref:DUF1599 domain-containing protein n=1 Tax=Gynurincola endophyticus TaxID=2479004 RepID=UPI000F8D9D23|nr:DUF1599 domain-containing protein [Gynurincola endophyticus]